MEAEPTLHPLPLPDPHHRKIELQSQQDLIYLQTNLIAAARQKLDLHFPPSAAQRQVKKPQPATIISLDGVKPASSSQSQQPTPQNGDTTDDVEADPMHVAVRGYVDAYISRIYQTASPSLTVNGLDATSLPLTRLSTKHPAPTPLTDAIEIQSGPREEKEGVDFDYEAHDTRLQKTVADMYAELEGLTVQVGQLRRTAPGQGAQSLGQLLSESMETDDNSFEQDMAALNDEAADRVTGGPLQLNSLPEEWFAERKVMYERGMNELSDLAGFGPPTMGERSEASTVQRRGASLTETVGKVQRARTVAMEFE